ncbi:MAG: M24B family metallopeptidase, partial [Schleiferiaceae bacterium]|nr:M24B family metallopeptidase [Schleiferiaceae bacterium]
IRAADIACTPGALSYLLIAKRECHWFIEPEKVPTELGAKLSDAQVHIHPYVEVTSFIENLPRTSITHVDLAGLSWSLKASFKGELRLAESLVQWVMALKTDVEVGHIRNAMAKDAVALTRMFMWLEKEVQSRPIKETEVAQKIAYFRSQQPGYQEESFPAIVGYKGNGAIVHYFAQEDTCAKISNEGMLLIDSGGQYVEGTTDITRTICLSEPTDEQKRNFTNVLKGNITLDTQLFPEGTTGMQLDTLARMHLWNDGLNYGHGTGHGVGYFLRVHEPPQGFATSAITSRGTTGFVPGLFTSNEPGFYKTDEYGIRIENLMLCVEKEENEYGKFLGHEALTLFPIETKLIDFSMLSQRELDWLNDYHHKVFEAVSSKLEGEELAWMKEKCKTV